MLSSTNQHQETRSAFLWLRRSIALLIVINLALVLFDLTYVNARSLYLQFVPNLVSIYDPIKGIRPHPETQHYLEQVAAVESQVAETGVESPQVEVLLSNLRSAGEGLLETNSFKASQYNVLQNIQQSLQERTQVEAVRDGFDRFWSTEHLTTDNWQTEIEFWHHDIQPLIAANYYRRINRFGYPVDLFWLIDLPFMVIFAIDLAIRDRNLRRRNPGLNRIQSLLRRWYDLLLLFPFWRWLRLIPATLRLQQVGLINLRLLQAEVRRDFAIGFATEITKLVGVQAIEQVQSAIRQGDVMRWVLHPETRKPYLDVGDRDEIEVGMMRVIDITIRRILPQIQSELELLIYANSYHILGQLPVFKQLQRVPGINNLLQQTTESFTRDISQRAYQGVIEIWNDPEIGEISKQIAQASRSALAEELKQNDNTKELENLLIDLLEEIKINYVKRLTDSEIEATVDKAEQIQRQSEAFESL